MSCIVTVSKLDLIDSYLDICRRLATFKGVTVFFYRTSSY